MTARPATSAQPSPRTQGERPAPDALAAWTQLMQRGEWAQAWALADCELPLRARRPCFDWPRHLQYVWTGAPPDGRHVLVRCYHGLGDTLQFIRYMPLLRARAREVSVWMQPKLIPLLGRTPGIDRVLPLHDGSPEIEFDLDVEIMELMHMFRSTPATVPAEIPYVHAEPMPLHRRSSVPAVGVAWRAGDWDPGRSIPFASMAVLAEVPGIELYILQPDAIPSGWDGRTGTFVGEFDLGDYARLLRAMDLLVTVDSMPAHLGGALGVPTWTLLTTDADWRWMRDRDDSPWYPGMRLFRQRHAGDWDDVLRRVARALARFADDG